MNPTPLKETTMIKHEHKIITTRLSNSSNEITNTTLPTVPEDEVINCVKSTIIQSKQSSKQELFNAQHHLDEGTELSKPQETTDLNNTSPSRTVNYVNYFNPMLMFTLSKKLIKTPSRTVVNYFNPMLMFTLSKDLKSVFTELPNFNKESKGYTYSEIILLLTKYLIKHKDTLFDPRNISVALVKDTPLGVALKVDAFHRCQAHYYLQKQLKLIKE